MTDLEQKREYIQQELTEDELQAVTGGDENSTGNIVSASIFGVTALGAAGGIAYNLRQDRKALQQRGTVVGGRVMLKK
jgi:bacteriocin-like protein